jgi:hypothetical protein
MLDEQHAVGSVEDDRPHGDDNSVLGEAERPVTLPSLFSGERGQGRLQLARGPNMRQVSVHRLG